MEVFRINKRNIFVLLLASLLLSSFLLCTVVRAEPEAGGPEPEAGGPEPAKDAGEGEAENEPESGEVKPVEGAMGPETEEPKQEANSPESGEKKVEEEEKEEEKTLKEDKPESTDAGEENKASNEGGAEEKPEEGEEEEEKPAEPEQGKDQNAAQEPAPEGEEQIAEKESKPEEEKDKNAKGEDAKKDEGGGSGFDKGKVEEKINEFCKPAKDANLCSNSILTYIGDQKFAEDEINVEWVLKMQVNATINQILTIQTFIRDMLKQRPQDQVLIKCKDAYFNFATDLGTALSNGDKVALKMLATDGPDKVNKDCTSLVDAQPSPTTPEIASKLKEVPNTNAPYLANVASLADPPKQRKLRKMKK